MIYLTQKFITNEAKMMIKDNNIIFGDYVITQQKNAYNDKNSYWISKKDHTVCLYCFSEPSYITIKQVYKMLQKDFKGYIFYYENYLNERIRKHEDNI